jgi:hypothetical protein
LKLVNSPTSRDVHVIGIRSKTKLTERVLREARNLIVIGCFCIGTNQVDLRYAADHGIAVFNSPFSNSRSVAELVIGEIIILARQLGDRSNEMHNGVWNKVSSKCWEVRGKTLGGFDSPGTPCISTRESFMLNSRLGIRNRRLRTYRITAVCLSRSYGHVGHGNRTPGPHTRRAP